jgi:uncharacterized protein
MTPSIDDRLEQLQRILAGLGPTVVGFSGGVDSTFLLHMARQVLGSQVLAVTTVSASLPERERNEAEELARRIGAPHRFVESSEFDNPDYLSNTPQRCFFCKEELFRVLLREAKGLGWRSIAYGAQADDAGEFRPGMEAARRYGARAPLLEAGLGKAAIRELSRAAGLPTWDKPAMACLASRIPHGTPIRTDDLRRVERAEESFRSEGFHLFRVRARGEEARIEVSREEMSRLSEPGLRERLTGLVRAAGFQSVVFDPEGYRPGGGAVFTPSAGEAG